MATEVDIQESVCLKKGEMEDKALTSESFEEKVTELSSNIMKQIETSNLVAETVNTPLEMGKKPTDESGSFFQSLSVPVVIADENSNKSENYNDAKQTESETVKNEEKTEDEIRSKLFDSVAPSKHDDVSKLEENKGDSDGLTISQDAACEEIKETTTEKDVITVADDFKDKSVDVKEASEQSEIESKDIEEQTSEEIIKKFEQDEEIKKDIELEKKTQNGSLQAITSDDQKDKDVNILEEDEEDKDDITRAQEVAVESNLQENQVVEAKESVEEETDDGVSKQTELVDKSIKNEEANDEKAIEKEVCEEIGSKKDEIEIEKELEISDNVEQSQKETFNKLEKDQGDSDDVTSSQEALLMDVKETTIDQHVTNVIDFEKQDMNEKPREFIEEEIKDKSVNLQEETKDKIEQDPGESVKKIEKDEETADNITTQTEPEEESREKIDEEAIERDDGQTSKSTTTIVKETCEDNVYEKTKLQEAEDKSVDVQEDTEQYDDGVNGEKEQKQEESVNETPHSYSKSEPEEYAKEIKATAETIEEKDVCISTQIESQEEATKIEENDNVSDVDQKETEYTQKVTKGEENSNEETIKNDGGQTQKPESPLIEEVCETTSLKVNESEEVEKHSESFSTTLNENETLSKEEKLEKEEEIKSSEVQGGEDDVTSSQNALNEDIKETTIDQHDTNVTYVEEGQGVSATPKEILIEKIEDKSVDAHEILELGQRDKQHVDETDACLSKTISENQEDEIKKEDKDLSHESVEDTNDDTTKNENEQELVKDYSDHDDVLNKKVTDSYEREETKPQEDITSSTSLETSTKDASNSEKEKAESESLPIQDLETVTQLDDLKLKEECFISETETQLDEEKEIVTKEISSDEKIEVQGGGDDVTKSHNTLNEDMQETTIDQHYTKGEDVIATSKDIVEEAEYKSIDAGESIEQPVGETKTISEDLEDENKKEDKDLTHESLEDIVDDTTKEEKCTLKQDLVKEHSGQDDVSKETTQTEPQEVNEEKETVIKEIANDEKIEVQSGGDDVASSQNTFCDDIKETTTDQHDANVTYVEEGQGVSATSKEIFTEEAEYKSNDVEKSNEHVEESKTLSKNLEDENKKADKDSSHESVEDTNDDTTKNENEQELVKDLSDRDDVLNKNVLDSYERAETKPQEDITHSKSLETSTKDPSNSEKENAESESLPIEDLETDIQIPELVSMSEDLKLKEECVISETESQLDEEKEAVTKEISSDEKIEVQGGGDDVTKSHNALNEDIQETTIDQHDTKGDDMISTSKNIVEEAEYKLIDVEESNEQPVGESKTISENPEDENKKEDKDLTHESLEDTIDDTTKEAKCTLEKDPVKEHNGQDDVSKETTETQPQEDITLPTSLETSAKYTSNSDKETVTETEFFISEMETHLNEEKETVTKEIANDGETKVQSGKDDVASSQNTFGEDLTETTTDQHDANVTYVEEGQGVSAASKEIFTEEAKYKSNDVEESNEHVEESKTLSKNSEDENKKVDKDLSHESVEDTNDDTTKEEPSTSEQEHVKKRSGHDEVLKENVTDLNETIEVEPQEDDTPSTLLETSIEETSNLKEKKAESEILHVEDFETASKTNIPEMVPKSEESTLKEESFISETETHLDEEKRSVTEEVSIDEKIEQTTKIEQEACEETGLGKAELEEPKLFDRSLKLNEKDITTFKDDDQEKDHEVNVSNESQGNEVSEEKEDLQEKNYHNESNEGDLIKSGEDVDEDTEEIKSSIETKENTKDVITTNVCSSTQIQTEEQTIENEEKIGEKVIENDDNELVIREEILEKKQEDVEVKKSFVAQEETEQYDDGENDIRDQKPEEHTDETKTSVETNEEEVCISTQTEKPTKGKENNDDETRDINDVQREEPESPLVETICEATSSEITETEGVKHSETFGMTLKENDTLSKDGKLEEEDAIKTISEVQGDGDDLTSSQNASNEDIQEPTIGVHDATVAYVEEVQDVSAKPQEILIQEAQNRSIDVEEMPFELGKPDKQDVEKTLSENPEEEIKKHDKDLYYKSVEDKDDTTEEENYTLKQESVEEHSDQDEVSKENTINLNETTEVEPQEDIAPSNLLETSIEDTSNSENEKTKSENLSIEDLETVSKAQIPELVPKSEEFVLKEEKGSIIKEILSDEKQEQTTDFKQETVKEICEETSSGKVEFEKESTLSDSSNVKITNNEIATFKDDDQEKDQVVNISGESHGKDNINISSHDEVSEEKEDSQENIYQDKDTEEVKSSVETKDYTENIITANVIEPEEEITKNEEKKEEKVIENDENDIVSREEYIEKKQVDVSNSTQTEPKEETVYNTGKDEEVVENDDGQMYLKKEKEFELSELQGGGDDVISSQDDSKEDTKETPNVDAITKEISGEELEDKSIHAQEASEECENKANDTTEQQHEETVSETVEKSLKEDVENKETQPELEAENQADRIEDRSEIKDEVVLTENVSKELDFSTIEHEPNEKQNDSQDELLDQKLNNLNENLETHGSTLQPENSYITNEENITQLEKIGEIKSMYENRDLKEEFTKESQLNTEDFSETVKDVILTEEIEKEKGINDFKEKIDKEKSAQIQKEIVHEISNLDSIPVENPEVTEEISSESKVTNDVDQEPIEVTIASEVESKNIESTDFDVQIPEVVEDSENSKNLEVHDDLKHTSEPVIEDQVTTTPPNQKELVNEEIEYSKPITVGNTEVTEAKAETQIKVENYKDEILLDKTIPDLEDSKTSGNENVDDVVIDEVLLEDKKVKESQSIKDITNEEVKLTQLTSDTNVQKHEKDFDYETEVKIADVVSNVESSETEPSRVDTKDETFEFINQEDQKDQKKETDEDVKTSATESEVKSVDIEVPFVTDATAYKENNKTVEVRESNEHLESTFDQIKPVIEGSGIKQESLERDEPTKDNSKVTENLIEERNLDVTKDQQLEKEEIGESGVKTDEEDDNEDDEKTGSCSDAPVMVEASKDIDVKVHKKSHNILSGVGSKVKHSIAKVKKAITGKSSPPKSPSPKANNQVGG